MKENITSKIEAYIQDPNVRKELLEGIDELQGLSKDGQWLICKDAIFNTILSERLNYKTAWRLYVVLQNIKGQSQHLEEWEKESIQLFRNTLKYSLSTIAFILNRSKETIYRHTELTKV